jgi:type II secretory pathway pseudopilin PulG
MRSGITLVEVVAGMTLLASLASGMLLALGAHQRQLRRAEQQIVAAEVADRLLGQWYAGYETIPRNRQGRVVAEQETWIWRTRTVEVTAVGSILIERVRLEIFRSGNRQDRTPSVVVELIAPVGEATTGAMSGI